LKKTIRLRSWRRTQTASLSQQWRHRNSHPGRAYNSSQVNHQKKMLAKLFYSRMLGKCMACNLLYQSKKSKLWNVILPS